ncbi:sigma-70 family RNA polymerase sigma factor [Niallia taxi]|uniref:sigma-70 family RNA polymerase sigma factor n=1 Tax=Niallia taxi TaxID=2499688 RepID=UPI00300A1EB0
MEKSLLENWVYRELSHEELINQYQETLDSVIKKRNEIKSEINNLRDILKGIKLSGKSNRLTKKRKAMIKERWQELEAEDVPYVGIQGDMEYALSWMKYGHAPGTVRGIERRAVYQNSKIMDPLLMQRFFRSEETEYSWDREEKENSISTSERLDINEVLSILTDKEKEFYLMSKGYSLSCSEIAKKMNVSRQTVNSTIKRAEKKIGLFLANRKEKTTNEYCRAN